jgi:hypothetical protein
MQHMLRPLLLKRMRYLVHELLERLLPQQAVCASEQKALQGFLLFQQ